MNKRRAALVTAGLVLAGPVVILVEVFIATRAVRLDGFSRGELDRRLGDPAASPLRVVWVGDSTGAGVGSSTPEHALPVLVASGLDEPVVLSVLAVSGARTRGVIDEQLPVLAELEPDLVFVGIGNNDVTGLTSRGRFRTELHELLEGIEAAGAERIVVLGTAAFAGTPLLRQPLRAIVAFRSRQLDAVIRDVADDHGAVYVPIADDTGAQFAAEPDRFHARDGFHPSDEGYALWANSTLEALRASRGGRSPEP